jgi:hypothetical protein
MQVFQDAGLGELRIIRPYEIGKACPRKICAFSHETRCILVRFRAYAKNRDIMMVDL